MVPMAKNTHMKKPTAQKQVWPKYFKNGSVQDGVVDQPEIKANFPCLEHAKQAPASSKTSHGSLSHFIVAYAQISPNQRELP